MNRKHSTAARQPASPPAESRSVGAAVDLVCRAIDLSRVAYMATSDLTGERHRDALATCLDEVDVLLIEAKAILYENIMAAREGGAS